MSDISDFPHGSLRPKSLMEVGSFGYMWNRVNDKRLIASHSVYAMLEIEPFSVFLTVDLYRTYIHPADIPKHEETEVRLFQTGNPVVAEYRIICENGKEKYIREYMRLMQNSNGVKVESVLEDITEEKQAEIILNVMNEAFFELDESFVFRRVNLQAELFWDKSRKDLIGQCIWSVFPEAVNTPLYHAVIKARKEKQSSIDNIIAPPVNRWIHASISPYTDGIIVIFYDIQNEKEAEQKLQESEIQWRSLVENTPDIITRRDKDLRLVYANPVFEKKVGLHLSGIHNRSLSSDDCGDLEKAYVEKLLRAFSEKKALDHFYVYPTAGGNIHYHSRLVPELDEKGNVQTVLSIARDITGIKKHEEDIKKVNESLIRKNRELELRNKELATLSNVTSTDMQEPLKRIYTSLEFILSKEAAKLSDSGKAQFRRMQSAVQKINFITDDLLSYVNVDKEPIVESDQADLNKVLEKAKQKLARNILESDAEITSVPLPLIKGNSALLVQLFSNLLHNAIKFQKPGKRPCIIITAEEPDQQVISKGMPTEGYVKICFKDNGIGFKQQDADQAFNLFTRLHDEQKYRGSGMGLAICKKIMEKHNGFIEVNTEEGKGSEFMCYFPNYQ